MTASQKNRTHSGITLVCLLMGVVLLVAACASESATTTAGGTETQTSASPPTTPIHFVSRTLDEEWSPPWQPSDELAKKIELAFPAMLVPSPPAWDAATYGLGTAQSWRARASVVTEVPDGTTRRELVVKDASGLLVIQLSWFRITPMPTTARWVPATVRGASARVFNTDTGAAIIIEWLEAPDTVQAKMGMLDWKAAVEWLDAWRAR